MPATDLIDELNTICKRHGCVVGEPRNQWIDERLTRLSEAETLNSEAVSLLVNMMEDADALRKQLLFIAFLPGGETAKVHLPPQRLDEVVAVLKAYRRLNPSSSEERHPS